MALIRKTTDGKMPPRTMASWRAGLLEDDCAEQKARAAAGDPDAIAMERMLASLKLRKRTEHDHS